MHLTQVTAGREIGNVRLLPATIAQEELWKFVDGVERQRRAAFLGYCAGFGLLASLALFTLCRVWA